jgi:hypothetical protein
MFITESKVRLSIVACKATLMTVRFLKSHLNVVARGHNLIARRPLSTDAAGDWLAGPLKTLVTAYEGDNSPQEGHHSQYQRREG